MKYVFTYLPIFSFSLLYNILYFLFQFMLRQKSLRLYREFLKTIKNIPLESDRQQFTGWVKEDFKKHKFETDEVWIDFLKFIEYFGTVIGKYSDWSDK